MDFELYKQGMAAAIANNDIQAIEKLNAEWNKDKAERRKAQLEAEQKEAVALAGVREKVAIEIHERLIANKPINNLVARLQEVKAHGFTFKLDEDGITYKAVALTVPTIKAKREGTGNGGGAGKTKDEYGMSLQEVYDKFHTAEDEVKLAEAKAADEDVKAKTGKSNQVNQWRVKNSVKVRVIADGTLKPQK